MPTCDECWNDGDTTPVGGLHLCAQCRGAGEDADTGDRAFRLRCLDFCTAAQQQVPWNEETPAARLAVVAELQAKREEMLKCP